MEGKLEGTTLSCTIKDADTWGKIALCREAKLARNELGILRWTDDELQQTHSASRREIQKRFLGTLCSLPEEYPFPFALYHTGLALFFQPFGFVSL